MSNLVTQDNCFLFYDGERKIAKSFDAAVLYTVVVNLKKRGTALKKTGRKYMNTALPSMRPLRRTSAARCSVRRITL
ncbi:MAG: hypothetical protein ACLR06_12090 [Christensenellaceae bacterium]